MDIENLIERLYKHHTDWGEGRTQDFFEVCLDCKESATALSTLQAENEKLREKIEDARLEGYVKGLGEMSEENERLWAELEQVKQKYSEASEAICTHCTDIPCRGENCYWWCGPPRR